MSHGFPETSWTLLEAARRGDGGKGGKDDPRNEFVQRYYKPVRAYLAAITHNSQEVEDLAQEFFASVFVTGRLLGHADRQRGPFRPYLKQVIRNFVIDWWRKQKRQPFCDSLDVLKVDSEELSDTPDPRTEQAFHRAWVESLLSRALENVEEICEKKGQQVHFDIFQARYLFSDADPPTWRELAERFGLDDEKKARSRAETVISHFRKVMQDMLTEELGSQAAADEEIATLRGLL